MRVFVLFHLRFESFLLSAVFHLLDLVEGDPATEFVELPCLDQLSIELRLGKPASLFEHHLGERLVPGTARLVEGRSSVGIRVTHHVRLPRKDEDFQLLRRPNRTGDRHECGCHRQHGPLLA